MYSAFQFVFMGVNGCEFDTFGMHSKAVISPCLNWIYIDAQLGKMIKYGKGEYEDGGGEHGDGKYGDEGGGHGEGEYEDGGRGHGEGKYRDGEEEYGDGDGPNGNEGGGKWRGTWGRGIWGWRQGTCSGEIGRAHV